MYLLPPSDLCRIQLSYLSGTGETCSDCTGFVCRLVDMLGIQVVVWCNVGFCLARKCSTLDSWCSCSSSAVQCRECVGRVAVMSLDNDGSLHNVFLLGHVTRDTWHVTRDTWPQCNVMRIITTCSCNQLYNHQPCQLGVIFVISVSCPEWNCSALTVTSHLCHLRWGDGWCGLSGAVHNMNTSHGSFCMMLLDISIQWSTNTSREGNYVTRVIQG